MITFLCVYLTGDVSEKLRALEQENQRLQNELRYREPNPGTNVRFKRLEIDILQLTRAARQAQMCVDVLNKNISRTTAACNFSQSKCYRDFL